jgi:hypothetical protein
MEISAIAEKDAEVWETSVEEVMIIFRDALASLDPFLAKARISSKEGKQYDDYDAIAEMLYEKIVINSIKWSFADSQEIELPVYGFEFDSAKHTAFIEVCLEIESDQKQYVFQNFFSEENPYDKVVCYPFGTAQSLFSAETAYVSLKDCSFQLRYKKENGCNTKSVLTVLL